jgi:CheY-like chemotaxis protein
VGLKVVPIETDSKDRLRLLFIVEDTGQGIAEDKLEEVFETFTQGTDSGSYTRKYQGVGLGLPLVKRLVKLLDGNMSITSQEGTGTSVYVSLPFKIPKSLGQKVSSSTYKARDTNHLKILLVDDDEITQLHIQKLMENQGNTVITVDNGRKALEEIQKDEFDCILMDIQLPVMDGLQATKLIRTSKAKFKDIPIIALTAYAMNGDREKFLEAGMDDYIAKPVDKDELLEVISRNLSP